MEELGEASVEGGAGFSLADGGAELGLCFPASGWVQVLQGLILPQNLKSSSHSSLLAAFSAPGFPLPLLLQGSEGSAQNADGKTINFYFFLATN